ncbi:single-stranded DNA-binding protein [Streptomyces indicus]|uniref:Single-strand DNA-binding protein n=1 Tax=Streptomyces indicus TaxID=417292 RepID=A0A1G9GCH3_9ACTN|nr:single-stranded DNA-binding protein [Streptomyces indicus]SDK98408.1 single-strand DNA-binding protein [Streptomyces indicus]
MNETLVTIVGNVATEPVARPTAGGTMVRFRLASTSRYFDRATQGWKDGHTNFLTVVAWRGLAENVASSLNIGDPVLVQGRLKVRQENGTSGSGGSSFVGADIEAVALGHDLSRGTAAFRRVARTGAAGAVGGAGGGAGPGGDTAVKQDGGAEPQFEREPGTGAGAAQEGFLPEREPEPVF